MYVSDWMTAKVLTVAPGDSVSDAVHLMQDNRIKHLPVLDADRLVGMLSDRDVRSFTPSKATSLDVFELHYLLARSKVRDAMSREVVTTSPGSPVEEAALLMLERNVGALPVLDEGALVGIISDRDVFRALVDISGVRHGGHRVCVTVADRAGSIREAADVVRRHGFRLQGILTSYEGVAPGSRRVVLRTDLSGDFEALRADLERAYPGVTIRRG